MYLSDEMELDYRKNCIICLTINKSRFKVIKFCCDFFKSYNFLKIFLSCSRIKVHSNITAPQIYYFCFPIVKTFQNIVIWYSEKLVESFKNKYPNFQTFA